ncbi:MAG: helix-turn-helix domain-containing protein [Syntrophobacteraceae bacterium]|nr:helix-turn-helix domain-containing protein [Syntrophobacteraceae bacterium]
MVAKNIEQEQPQRGEITLSGVLHALSDPVRLEIVQKLARSGQISCGCFGLTMPKSSLSHHFKVLRSSGVVATRREGKNWVNSLRKEDLDVLFPGVIDSILAASAHARPKNRGPL